MNWIGILVGAAAGGLAALILSPVVRRLFKEEAAQKWVYLILFAVVLAGSREWVTPLVARHYEAATIEEQFSKSPAFVALKAYEPVVYADLITKTRSGIKGGASFDEMFYKSNAVIQQLMSKRLPTSSNSAALSYMRVMIDEVRWLYGKGGDLCYSAILPAHTPGVLALKDLPLDLRDADANALHEVLRTAALNPQSAPTEAQFLAALGTNGLPGLDPEIVPELDHLDEAKQGLQARRRTCEVTLHLYDAIFKLPVERSGLVVRYFATLN